MATNNVSIDNASRDETGFIIWDTMVFEEKKRAAEKLGVRLSDYEEDMNLRRAIEESELHVKNDGMNGIENQDHSNNCGPFEIEVESTSSHDYPIDDYNDAPQISFMKTDDQGLLNKKLDSQSKGIAATCSESDSKSMLILSNWQLLLPSEVSDHILIILCDIDACGYLNFLAKTNC